MPTNTELLHASIRAETGTTGTFNGDWHALFDQASIADGHFNGRLLAWLNDYLGASYVNLPEAKQAYAEALGFYNWDSINSWDLASIYTVLGYSPKTVADFQNEYYRTQGVTTTFDDMFTYTGASNKTMTDSDGNLKYAPHNLIADSEGLTTGWTVQQLNITTGQTDHLGGTTAVLLEEDSTASSAHRTYEVISSTQGGAFGYAKCYARRVAGSRYLYFRWDADSSNRHAVFDLSGAGSVVNDTSVDSTISLYNGGPWYECTSVWTNLTSGTTNFIIGLSNLNNAAGVSYSGDGSSSIAVSQMRVGYHPAVTSYVPTTSTPVYMPRRNSYRYNGSAYVKKGITLETAAATNLLAYSSIDDGTQWTESGVTNTVDNATGPDGETSATLITATAGGTAHYCQDTWSVAASVDTYCASAYVKAGTTDFALVYINGATPGLTAGYVMDLSDGTIAQTLVAGDVDPYVEDVGGGWWRISIVSTSNGSSGNPGLLIGPHDGSASLTYSAAGTETIYAYGAQAEISPIPTSYIPTTGATATRSAETLSIAAANMAYSSTGMSIQMQGEHTYADTADSSEIYYFFWDADLSNFISHYMSTASTATGQIIFNQTESGTTDTVNTSGTYYSPGLNGPYNHASRHTATAINAAVQGASLTENATPTALPDLSGADLEFGASNEYIGTIALFRQWDADITDAGIAEATDQDTAAVIQALFNTDTYTYQSGTSVDFDTLFDYTTTSNSTMVDSDGNLKWAPHNRLTYSEDLTNAIWTLDNSGATNPVVTANAGTAPDGSSTADRIVFDKTGGTFSRIQHILSGLATGLYTFAVWMKSYDGSTYNVGIRINTDSVNCEVTNTWQLFTVTLAAAGTVGNSQILLFDSIVGNDETADVLVWGAHVYRSDLGGTVNNPDRGDSYVPTTSAAVYLPRRNAYRYTGAAYENKGLLLESAASTNVCKQNLDLSDTDYWTPFGTGMTESAYTSPTGASDARSYVVDSGGGTTSFGVRTSSSLGVINVDVASVYTVSVYMKPLLGTTEGAIRTSAFTTGDDTSYFTLTGSGSVAATGVNHDAAYIEEVGGGWYRCSVVFTTDVADTSGLVYFYASNGSQNVLVNRDGNNGIAFFGPQVEKASISSSFMPTGTATATRAAQTLTIPAANMAWNNEGQCFQIECEINYADTGLAIEKTLLSWNAYNTTPYEYIAIDTGGANTGNPEVGARHADLSNVSNQHQTGYTPGVNVAMNIASRRTPNGVTLAKDGVADSSGIAFPGALGDLSSSDLEIFYNSTGAPKPTNGYITAFRYWDVDLYDAGIEEQTS